MSVEEKKEFCSLYQKNAAFFVSLTPFLVQCGMIFLPGYFYQRCTADQQTAKSQSEVEEDVGNIAFVPNFCQKL